MNGQRNARARADTAHSYAERFNPIEEENPVPEPKARIGSIRQTSGSVNSSPRRELPGFDFSTRPSNNRTSTFEGPLRVQSQREASPMGGSRLSRVPTEPLPARSQLRPVQPPPPTSVFANEDDYQDSYSSARSASPAGSHTSVNSRTASVPSNDTPLSRKAPPPPPPSRAKKPPPPPPMKRSALSTSEVPYA